MIYTSSGKQALSLICDYLLRIGYLEKKQSEILVPKFMGNWIYSNYNQSVYTSTQYSKDTKLLHLYHQFGIPQKTENLMNFTKEKKIKIIEDCAHVLLAKKEGRNCVGNIGDFSVYSFSKFTECFLLGGVSSKDANFNDDLKSEISNSSKFLTFFNYLLINLYKLTSSKKIMDMNYSIYHYKSKPLKFLIKKYEKIIEKEKKILSERYELFKKEIGDYVPYDYLEYDELLCNFLPVEFNKEKVRKIKDSFKKYKITTTELYFDKNREMLDPEYVKSIGLFLSSSNRSFEKSVEIIKQILKS